MLAGELHPAAKSGLGRHVQQGRVLAGLGAGVAPERERIAGPEKGRDRALSRLSAIFGDILARPVRKLSSASFLLGEAGFASEKIGDDAGFARLRAAVLP